MKKIPHLLLMAFLLIQIDAQAQFDYPDEFTYQVNTVYPPFSITKDKLLKSQNLTDLSRTYRPVWVKEYLSVDISTEVNGIKTIASGKNDQLNDDQKKLMAEADPGKDINVKIHYIPNNNLKSNPPKEMDFTLKVNPDEQATFPDGEEALKSYLTEKAAVHISDTLFTGYKLAVVKFVVDAEGNIVDPKLYWSSEDKVADEILLKTVCDMPKWVPAAYSNGERTSQEFAFTMGNMQSCVVPTLNIRTNE